MQYKYNFISSKNYLWSMNFLKFDSLMAGVSKVILHWH